MDPHNLKKEYSNGEITVVWKSGLCIHSGVCVKNLSRVFQPQKQPWIKIQEASSQEIMDTINKCPSGALSFYKNDDTASK